VTVDSAVARITPPGGTGKDAIGTGILVDEATVITCAHVIVRDVRTGPPPEPVRVDVAFLQPEATMSGTVAPHEWYGATQDLAVVRLDRPMGDRLPASLVAPHDLTGLKVELRGFPRHFDAGDAVVGYATGMGGEKPDWWRVEPEGPIAGSLVQPRFSGGPAWCDEVQGVVGMTVARPPETSERPVAFVIPMRRLVEAHPQLALRVAPWFDDAALESRLRSTVADAAVRYGPRDPRTVGPRQGLALALLRLRTKLPDAEDLLRQNLDALDADPLRVLGVHVALADLYACQLREAEAGEQLAVAEAIAEEHLAREDLRRLAVGLARADLLVRAGKMSRASELVDAAHVVAQRRARSVELISTLSMKALLDGAVEPQWGEMLARDALRLGRDVLPADDPGISRLARLAGGFALQLGDVDTARALVDEALTVAQSSLGSHHLDVAECHRMASMVRLNGGQVPDAGAAAATALNIAARFYGDGHGGTAPFLVQLAYVRQAEGHLRQAQRLVGQAVDGAVAAHGPDDLRVGSVLSVRADLAYALGEVADGDRDAAAALGIAEVRLADDAAHLVGSLLMNAHTHLQAGRPDEAERVARRAGEILDGQDQPPDWPIAAYAVTLGRALALQGRDDEAVPLLDRAVRIYESTRGVQRVLLGQALLTLGVVLARQGDRKAGAEYASRGRAVLAATPVAGVSSGRPPGSSAAEGSAMDLVARGVDWWLKRRKPT